MTVNSDVGDSWEFADDLRYEERFSALGIRIGVNYIYVFNDALATRDSLDDRDQQRGTVHSIPMRVLAGSYGGEWIEC